jgi:large subunit ribosomal protein L25
MSSIRPTIKASRRERLGTRYAARLRKTGQLPAVIYGHQTAPIAVSVDAKEALGHLHHGLHVMDVALDGGKAETCLVKELQFGFLGDNVIHIDFARVDLDELVEVKVHLKFIGSPESAKATGAVLTYDLTDLEVRCKVRDIPEEVRIDLGNMQQMLQVKDIHLPAGISPAVDPEKIVAHISFIAEEVAVTPEAAAVEGAAAAAEPEVISETKRKEAEAAAAAAAAEKK